MIRAGMGLEFDQSELFRLFTMLKVRNPDHLPGHINLLYALTAKWGGSDEAMFSFARKSFDQARAGSPFGILIAQAHIEKWSSIYFDDELDKAQDYICSDHVRKELILAYQQSIAHPDYQAGAQAAFYSGMFGMAFYLSGETRLAINCCSGLRKASADYPWYYLYEVDNADLNTGYIVDKVLKDLGQ